MAAVTRTHPRRRASLLLGGILPLGPGEVQRDAIAGITLAALAVPEVMGYAKIAGTPVITGLYTLLLPIFAFAVFGSSRHLVVGADSATAAILATGLVGIGATAGSPDYIELASLAALMCAVLLLVARLLRLGFIANFLSRSVLVGFLTGVGIQVAIGQVGAMFGVSGQSGNTLEKFANTLRVIPTETNVPTLVISLLVIGVTVGLERVNKAIPGALFAVIGAIAGSYFLDLSSHGVGLLGSVPSGLPSISLPTAVFTSSNLAGLLPVAISMVVVILAQSAATSRAYAMKYGDRFDENVDLVGLGLANAAAGITGTFVVNGSPTKSEMVDSAGGRSQIAQVTAGVLVIVVLLFLTPALAYLPNAALATVVFIIGLRLVNWRGMVEIARLRPGEFVVALVTAAVVVAVGVEQGVLLAMGLSVIEHISHSYHPYDTLLVEDPNGAPRFAPLADRSEAVPGLFLYRFGTGLYYANASRFAEEVTDLVEGAEGRVRWFGVVGSSIGDIDYSGADTIRQIAEELGRVPVVLALSDLSPRVRSQLDAYGLTPTIGNERIFPTARELVAAYEAAAGTAPEAAPAAAGGSGPAPATTGAGEGSPATTGASEGPPATTPPDAAADASTAERPPDS